MTLIVENGTGLANADSYLSAADADQYLAARGYTLWAPLLDAEKEQALRRATDYMVAVYRERWGGYRGSVTQALDWPRSNVEFRDGPGRLGLRYAYSTYYPNNSVPLVVGNACAELALRAAAGPLILDEGQMVKSKQVGPVKIEYQDYSRATKTYRGIDKMLAPLLAAPGGIRISRA